MTTDTRHPDPGDFGLPLAEAGVLADKATATCPACGYLAVGDDPKAAGRAYAAHYGAARRSEEVTARAAEVGLPDPMPLIDNVAAEVYAQLDELSDDTITLAYEDTGDDDAQNALIAVADDLRETLRATIDQRLSDYLDDLNLPLAK